MKINKNELRKIIESYLLESSFGLDQMVGPDGTVPGDKYPEYVTTDNQKQQYDLIKTAERRRIDHPDSEAGLQLRWPQDFVMFEEEFEEHIANWRLFKREYPKSAFLLQIFDLSGVSGYGDLANSLEKMIKPGVELSIPEKIVFFLDLVSALPIGLSLSLTSGRLGIKALQGIRNSVKANKTKGLEILKEVIKSSGKFQDILTESSIRSFFSAPQVVKLIKGMGKEITDDFVNNAVKNLQSLAVFLDSFGVRALMKSWGAVTGNLKEEIRVILAEYIGVSTVKDLANADGFIKYLMKKLPADLAREIRTYSNYF